MERDIRKIVEGSGTEKNLFTVGSPFSIKGSEPFTVERIKKGIGFHTENGFEVAIPIFSVYLSQNGVEFLWKDVNANYVSIVEYTIPESLL